MGKVVGERFAGGFGEANVAAAGFGVDNRDAFGGHTSSFRLRRTAARAERRAIRMRVFLKFGFMTTSLILLRKTEARGPYRAGAAKRRSGSWRRGGGDEG